MKRSTSFVCHCAAPASTSARPRNARAPMKALACGEWSIHQGLCSFVADRKLLDLQGSRPPMGHFVPAHEDRLSHYLNQYFVSLAHFELGYFACRRSKASFEYLPVLSSVGP